jgi:hypothetical protein
MMNKTLFALITLLLTAPAAADEILSGRVLEKGTRKPIAGAFVSVREDETLTTVTDDLGNFQLNFPQGGSYTLTAATLGSGQPVVIPVIVKANNSTPSPTFYLNASTTLDEIVVRAERSPDRVSKSVIRGSELRKIAGSSGDPLRGLQSLPGVIAAGNGSAPAVRGTGPGDNLFYVDSLPIGKIFHYGGISVFNGDLIQDFNLYSAAFAPRFGDVTGAVLDVALRDPRTDRLGGKANISLTGADFLVEGPASENQSFYFAARRSYFDLLIKQIEQKGVTIQIPNYSDYQGKYIWKLNGTDRLTFETQGATDALKLSVGNSADISIQQPKLTGDLNFSDSYAMQAAILDHLIFSDTQNKLVLEHVTSQNSNTLAALGNIAIGQEIYQLRDNLKLPLNATNELILGANAGRNLTTINADIASPNCTQFTAGCDFSSAANRQLNESFYVNTWEISAQDRAKISPTVTLVGGIHQSGEDYLNRTFTEPRLGIEWDLSERTLLTAGWGKHNQFPVGQQVARNFGNPNLDHLLAEHSVLGISQKLAADWSWKAETYYKKLSNLVVGVTTPENYVNGASGKAYGAELLIKKEATADISGWLSVSLAKSERQNDLTGESFRYQFDQPVTTTLVTNYKLNDDWTMGAKWNYHSGTPYTPVIGRHLDSTSRWLPDYAAINSGTLPDYHRLDIRFDRNYVFNTWKLNTYFELNNVYFQKNVSGYRYDATYSNYANPEAVLPLTIPFSFGVQGEF